MSVQAGLTAKFTRPLRAAPATVPALGALALFVVWAGSQAGYPVTHWAPGGLIMLVLLAIASWNVPLRMRTVPVPVRVALGCLGLYTILSFLSILWASVPGDAWEGANRTLLYLLVFALFALWPQRGDTAALLLITWVLAMIALATFVILHVDTRSSLAWFADEGRLSYPAGYENASAATWVMAMWPALLLAAERRIPWGVRGVLAGGAVLLADLSLLSLSRGSLYATPVMLILIFALLPGRLRTFAVLVPIAIGIAVSVPAILLVGERVLHGGNAHAALHTATAVTFAAAVAVGAVVALGGAIESRRSLAEVSARRLRRILSVVAIATLAVVLAGGWIATGNPVTRVRHAWDTFKSGSGYAANGGGNRLTSGLGSDRYDFYRVALDEFLAHPLVGIGADNFQQQYLLHGRGGETPHYPHSVELRTLSQSGLIGALLTLVGLGAALVAGGLALRPRRRPSDPLARAIAAAALAGFAYWLVHGSFDWFWEFAGLGAPAFAMLGLACALAPRGGALAPSGAAGALRTEGSALSVPPGARPVHMPRSSETASAVTVRPSRPSRSARYVVIVALGALVATVSLTAPWLSQLELHSAARIWPRAPEAAYSRLNDAARLNPLSDEPYLVAGSIALRFDDLARADHEFTLALGRTPGDAYATLERGAIASARSERARALVLLKRAARLDPRDPLIREVLALVRKGQRVDVQALNRAILVKAQLLA